ncbi:methyltransferase [Chitinophagales bacterium]|nr:methyltransferase [Chitinophagales bacterium]
MGRNYFQFKQFRIEQDQCANKVSTDACVFGAWLKQELCGKTILDVGCGTGLISLMLAQERSNQLTGIEIHMDCAQQARNNINNSPWSERIKVIQADIRQWQADKNYDCIVCNPPFFNNTSLSRNEERNLARQTATLSPSDWAHILNQDQLQNSDIYLLLSTNDVLVEYQKVLASIGFSHQQTISLFDHAKASCKRVILVAKRVTSSSSSHLIIYKKADGSYTEQFVDLLREFYIHY